MNTLERRDKIKSLLPRTVSYGVYPEKTIENCNEIIKLISNEPNKKLQHTYFKALADALFMKSPSFFYGTKVEHHEKMLKQQTPEIRSMLRKLKRLHFDIDYKPGCMLKINALIRAYGGTIMTKEQMREQKKEKFARAAEKVLNSEKMPRKKKKELKKDIKKMGPAFIMGRFVNGK